MTALSENTSNNHFIDLLRDIGYNCFPIPQYQKAADFRYDASRTIPNQMILEHENYGYIAVKGAGTGTIDLDDKERYRPFAEWLIRQGYMVIESPNGWHAPVCGISGKISKTELFDYSFQEKKIIEIQGPDHYCIGPRSQIKDKDGNIVTYQNRGTEKIWNCSMEFHELIDFICQKCNVNGRKKNSRSSYHSMRERFKSGQIPTPGTSNDYFFQAALLCNTDCLSQEEALARIKPVYEKWEISDYFSARPWSNVEAKVTDVYHDNLTLNHGRPKNHDNFDRTQIAKDLIAEKRLYSDDITHEIFEDRDGFLQKINDSLKRELQKKYPQMEKSDYDAILFKLEGMAEPVPDADHNIIAFGNGKYSITERRIIPTGMMADMGFPHYKYLEPTEQNKPKRFVKILFENVPESEYPRVKAGLKSILSNRLDPKISIIYGLSGVGKSTPLLILVQILGQYAMAVELDQILDDRFIRAKINGLRLLVLQDLPIQWKDFSQIKTMTGESIRTERGFMQDSCSFESKLKIWASANYLPKIPIPEQNAMYSRRLSVLHNQRKSPYHENPDLIDEIIQEEGEKIISWILNIPDEECQYEDSGIVKSEWQSLASPEVEFLQKNYEMSSDWTEEISVRKILDCFGQTTEKSISLKQMCESLKEMGYTTRYNIIKNIKPKPTYKDNQNRLD